MNSENNKVNRYILKVRNMAIIFTKVGNMWFGLDCVYNPLLLPLTINKSSGLPGYPILLKIYTVHLLKLL